MTKQSNYGYKAQGYMTNADDIETARQRVADHDKQVAETARKVAEELAFERKSKQKVLELLHQFIKAKIKIGNLTADDVANVYSRFNLSYNPEILELIYVRWAVMLLSHPQYGVELAGHRVGNGGLIWRGKSYKTSTDLYIDIQKLLGNDPLDSQVWFDYCLQSIFDDGTFLPAEIELDRFSSFMYQLKELVKLEANPIDIPDKSELTASDMFFIASLFNVV
ncbi:hypothetical protein CLI64_13615 [Nostoc sp. CENA543]|uniref:hypothetical protein n=1 Tax=Nostoc sp. CENA543 TaxID=1869241 RepID=UPI000CA24E78|nr:hypothetical protein [Nostoc sp. CENA543]AUT01354.1 hypothetical protein CLI64_13615 [Nostoc sp. CENA543]